MSLLKRASSWFSFALLALFLLGACGSVPASNTDTGTGGTLNVVAAENFYGDIVKQLGGNYVNVTSILSDPQTDPHTYESNVQNGIAVTKAQLVIMNGGGYDDWMEKLLSASPNDSRAVINAFEIAPNKLPDNEHVWYGLDNVQKIADQITGQLKKLDSAHATTFDSNKQKFDQSLDSVQQKIDEIKTTYTGTPVGLTETIFLYQTGPLGLKVLTPFEFQKAVAEGNDPPADTVATANTQASKREIKVLIYNKQTVTPLTTNLQNLAQQQHIPVIPVTETMPTDKSYQQWMLDQLTALEQGLQSNK